VITLEDLDVVFGRTVALDRINAALQPQLIGLFGPNGSGKSTLLRVIAGLLAPSGGRVLVNGVPSHPAAARSGVAIGYAGHSTGLYPQLTLKENLELFARLTGASADRPAEAIDMLDLSERRSDRVGVLSAGVKRRASVARALINDPDVLLLDEPYANVDDEAATSISDAITTWWRPGRTGIVATHGAKRVRQYATTSLVLRRGKLAALHDLETST
jgi:heme exporter protein A